MKRLVAGLVMGTVVSVLHAQTEIPERFRGTWAIDDAGSAAALESWSGDASVKQRSSRELNGLRGATVTLNARELVFEQGGSSDADPLNVVSVEERSFVIEDINGGKRVAFRLEGLDGLVMQPADGPPMVFARFEGDSSSPDPSASNAVDVAAYLDALKTCAQGVHSISVPGMSEIHNIINGRVGDRCEVEIATRGGVIACRYSSETIALLTSPQKYEDARNGVFQGSTDSEESRRVAEECEMSQ